MNGKPPEIQLALWSDDGELEPVGSYEIAWLGCVPGVGDIIADDINEVIGHLRVRRRIFIPMTGDRDFWWLICDRLPDDTEIDALTALDAEVREEFKAIEREAAKKAAEAGAASDKIDSPSGPRTRWRRGWRD